MCSLSIKFKWHVNIAIMYDSECRSKSDVLARLAVATHFFSMSTCKLKFAMPSPNTLDRNRQMIASANEQVCGNVLVVRTIKMSSNDSQLIRSDSLRLSEIDIVASLYCFIETKIPRQKILAGNSSRGLQFDQDARPIAQLPKSRQLLWRRIRRQQ